MFISTAKLINSDTKWNKDRLEIASTLPQVRLGHRIILAPNVKKKKERNRKFFVFNSQGRNYPLFYIKLAHFKSMMKGFLRSVGITY